jgi:hypothetical protein
VFAVNVSLYCTVHTYHMEGLNFQVNNINSLTLVYYFF